MCGKPIQPESTRNIKERLVTTLSVSSLCYAKTPQALRSRMTATMLTKFRPHQPIDIRDADLWVLKTPK